MVPAERPTKEFDMPDKRVEAQRAACVRAEPLDAIYEVDDPDGRVDHPLDHDGRVVMNDLRPAHARCKSHLSHERRTRSRIHC